ncbi:MAG: 3-deoxy-D-manno-octulosonate cytidylyltransferase [Cellvibrionales bacterium TMED21]|nr:3-deoxy-manno-octulosonate cytidylyltransferase [Halieaceae bacterium]OUT66516.1 MAG: 3-deoxy-D-manno-octulosonate cytidylyltransferase [Cellvibrionales bacterium TMED21]|tara:strand:- start:2516 stop:3259 length:744 start_codon:yes stop_codon:yes gene_type:complete
MYRIVIPARYGSTRLPAKALADIGGRPLVYWVWSRAIMSAADSVTVATDDQRIVDVFAGTNADVVMTRDDHQSGTDRIAEVANLNHWAEDDIVVNLQGDEPLMPIANLDQVASLLKAHPSADIATVCEPITSKDEFDNPSVVKVIADQTGRALYFSRAPIPHIRDGSDGEIPNTARRHIGLYAYRVSFLKAFANLPESATEKLESLEQLRALDNGREIRIADCAEAVPAGVDTLDDLEVVRQLMAND